MSRGEARSDEERPVVLVVEDEPAIRDILELGLRAAGFGCLSAPDAASGRDAVRRARPDAVLLDLGLPDRDGLALLELIRSESRIPVLVLTARTELDERLRSFDLGADDFIPKPFHLPEVVARIRARLRVDRAPDERTLRFADVELDRTARTARRAGRPIELTPREFDLLELLVRHAGEALSKEQILARLWGYPFDPNLVEVYVGYLRRKLGEPPLIRTVRGVGYALREDDR